MRTWQQMERLVELGLVRHVGTSNMTIPKLELLLRDARVRPTVNQMAWRLKPEVIVSHLFPLAHADAAYRVADGGQSGKVCIVMDEE
jgi:diketogulonate reductase-like aldo/keto reductase